MCSKEFTVEKLEKAKEVRICLLKMLAKTYPTEYFKEGDPFIDEIKIDTCNRTYGKRQQYTIVVSLNQ